MAGGVKVSVAFNDVTLEPSPSWTDLTATDNLVAGYTIDRGRQFEFDKTDTGTATVKIFDQQGVLDPTNSAGPYYGLLEPLLQIKIELWDPVASAYSTRFRGFIEDFDYTILPFVHQDAGGDTVGVTTLQISCVDIFEILTAIEMQPDGSFGDTPPAQSTGNIFFDNATAHDRITQVLGNAGIDSSLFVVFTLNVYASESVYSPSENVLQVVQDAADAEFPTVSNVYVDRTGRLCVHGREAKFDPDTVAAGAGAAWLFTRWSVGDGKAVAASPSDTAHLRAFSYNRGLSKVFNSAFCTPNGIDALPAKVAGQIYQDSGSISQYGIRSWSAENLFIAEPTSVGTAALTTAGAGILTGNSALDECLAFATYIVENFKTPRNRVSGITFRSKDPAAVGAGATWALLCGCDISDVVEVTVRGPGDSPTGYVFNAEEFFVEGIHEEVAPLNPDFANVTLTLDLSPKAYFPIGGGGGVGV